MKITSASKKVLASALSAAMVVAFAPTVAFAGTNTEVTQAKAVASVTIANTGVVKYYDNLEAALNAATSVGDKVTLLGDIAYNGNTETDTMYVASSGTLTINAGVIFDGKGFTIKDTVKDHSFAGITVAGNTGAGADNAPTVIKDVTLVDNAKGNTVTVAVQDATSSYVTISGVAAEQINANDYTTIASSKADTVAVAGANKVTFESGEYGIVSVAAGTEAVVKDGTYKAIVNASNALTIKGGKFTGGMDTTNVYRYAIENGTNATTDGTAKVVVENGEFTGYIADRSYTYTAVASSGLILADFNAGKYYTKSSGTYNKAAGTLDTGGTTTYYTAKSNILVKGGTYVDDPTAWLDTNVSAGQDETTKIWSVGTGVTNDAATIASIGDAANANDVKAAKKVVAAATSAWLTTVKALTMPAELAFDSNNKSKTIVDLYNAVMSNGAQTVLSLNTGTAYSYEAVKDVTAASTAAAQATKASYDKIEAAAAAAKLTTAKDDLKANETTANPLYTQFYAIGAKFNNMCDASSLGAGNEVTYYISTGSIKDYSDNYAYKMVFDDGTVVAGTVEAAVSTGSADAQHVKRIAFKTAKTGNFALAYTDTVADTKAELDEIQKQLDELKAQQDADKATIVALQDEVAAKSAAGKTKTVKLNGKSKTTKKQTVTLKAVKSESGATMTFKKTSGSSKVSVAKSGKATLKKGVKKGTYTAKVKATVGASSQNVTVKFVVK